MENIFIKRKFIEKIIIGDNFLLDFGFDNEKSYKIIDDNEKYYVCNETINIDLLIEKLNNLKVNGSSHVDLFYHSDHCEYELQGYSIKLANDEEIGEIIKQKEELIKQIKINEINQLKLRLKKLENELS